MKYHTLILKTDGKWRPEFGCHDHDAVKDEASAYREDGHEVEVITTDGTQEAIDAEILRRNGGADIVAVFDDGFRYHWDEARNLWTDGDIELTGCRNGIDLANFALNSLPPNCCIYHFGQLVNVQNFANEARLWGLVEGV